MSATSPTVVILAAGLGTRLGRRHPKPLTRLHDGRSILQQQLDHVRSDLRKRTRVVIVVGYKKELIMEAAAADATFVYNDLFDETNTSKSLLRALRMAPPGGVLWMNGDVVFTPGLLQFLRGEVAHGSFVAVNTARVADEEVKYTLDAGGHIAELSKSVVGGLGEAIGINYVTGADRKVLARRLHEVDAQDYFEKGIENAITKDGLKIRAVDVSQFGVVEVDFDDDLTRANLLD
ncbi:phosphocholine cytidylyltransferase family protein [Jatrophihabitans sp. YIM 134969]